MSESGTPVRSWMIADAVCQREWGVPLSHITPENQERFLLAARAFMQAFDTGRKIT